METPKKTFKQKLTHWLGSYIITAVILFFYFNAPLLPLVLGGFLTLAIVFIRRSA